MSKKEYYHPYEEMKKFYKLDNPTEEEQFRYVEALKFAIDVAVTETDIIAFSYNLAIYYRNIKDFRLERKYLEIGEEHGSEFCKEQLGFLWYYGLGGKQDYEKAYNCFKECRTRRGSYMIADMYYHGQYVPQNKEKSRAMMESLFDDVECERGDGRFAVSTLFPEIALRLVRLKLEDETDTGYDLDCLLDARDILAYRQSRNPFWGNIETMKGILETTEDMCGGEFLFADLYDLLTFKTAPAVVTFDYDGNLYRIDISRDEEGVVYIFEEKYFKGAEDFLERARIGGKRITTIYNMISNINVLK